MNGGTRIIGGSHIVAPLLIAAALLPWLALTGRSVPGCPTTPISLDRLNAVIAAAMPTGDGGTVPVGVRRATPREEDDLRSAVYAFVACSDAGEPLRVLALYTDRYLGDLYYRQGQLTEEQYDLLARPEPAAPDERTYLLAVDKVKVLADGRITGEVVLRYAVIPVPKRLLVTVARTDGAWRIDDILGELTFALP